MNRILKIYCLKLIKCILLVEIILTFKKHVKTIEIFNNIIESHKLNIQIIMRIKWNLLNIIKVVDQIKL